MYQMKKGCKKIQILQGWKFSLSFIVKSLSMLIINFCEEKGINLDEFLANHLKEFNEYFNVIYAVRKNGSIPIDKEILELNCVFKANYSAILLLFSYSLSNFLKNEQNKLNRFLNSRIPFLDLRKKCNFLVEDMRCILRMFKENAQQDSDNFDINKLRYSFLRMLCEFMTT